VGKHKQAGFTVIELLVAIAVVGILVPTLSGFVTELNALNDRARDLTIVNSLAENKIESLRSKGFTSLSDGTTTFTTELPVTLGSPKSATYVVSTPHTGIKQIDMTISYKDHGRIQTAQYTTYIGELGVGQY
jgi:prepilin-type N-terminal cleavage/methylation domain-containing protein